MKFLSKFSIVFVLGIVMFSSCEKEDSSQEINNYYTTPDNHSSANMKLLKEYGNVDSTAKLTFTYYNGEKSKLKELLSYVSGTPNAKLIINYNGSGKPESFQLFSLPANTLNFQGTYEVDAKNNITKAVYRNNIGDTTGIFSFAYILVGSEYKVASTAYFTPTDGKNIYYNYFEYDEKGFLTKVTGYDHTGATLYKSSVTECTSTNVINSLPNIMNYTLLISSSNLKGTACLYFSSYIPSSARTDNYNSIGGLTGTDIEAYTNIQSDADDNITSMNVSGSGTYFKY